MCVGCVDREAAVHMPNFRHHRSESRNDRVRGLGTSGDAGCSDTEPRELGLFCFSVFFAFAFESLGLAV